jgi:acetylglutamate kinase
MVVKMPPRLERVDDHSDDGSLHAGASKPDQEATRNRCWPCRFVTGHDKLSATSSCAVRSVAIADRRLLLCPPCRYEARPVTWTIGDLRTSPRGLDMAKPPSAPPIAAPSSEARPSAHMQARLLAEALPSLIAYDEETVVIKFGGNAMGDDKLAEAFAQDIVYLKLSGINPVVVHGGGPQIAAMLKKLDIKSEFVQGLRVTDKPTVEVVEMVLAGAINKEIVSSINRQGGKAVGISGKDANLLIAKKVTELADPESNIMKAVDIGYVGDPVEINPYIVEVISKSDLIPVVAPVAMSREGETLNVNADTFASALAARLKAKRLLMLTDIAGVLDKEKRLLPDLTIEEARAMIRDGSITGGMIPKIEGCIEVVEAGVEAVSIIDGRVPHCVLLELFTEHGVGTIVRRKRK